MRQIIRLIFVEILAVFACFILMVMSYQLPFKPIEDNVKESLIVLNEEGNYPKKYGEGTQLDNYTDALIMSESMCIRDATIKDAMRGGAYRSNNDPLISLNKYFNEGNKEIFEVTHYWHGNLVLMRPLLVFFNYTEIRVVNFIVLSFLLIYIFILMKKNKVQLKYVVPFVLSFVFVKAWIIPLSLQYSCMFYILFIEIILILKYDYYFKINNRYYVFFMLAGLFTSYFDYLTIPIVSLGGGLIFISILREDININKEFAKFSIICSICWGMGYFGMWFAKWVIATLVLGENHILKGMANFLYRTSNDTYLGASTPWLSVYRNVIQPGNFTCLIYLGLILGAIAIDVIVNKGKVFGQHLWFYILVICMPLVWYMALKNHSIVHAFFTYRALMVSVFGIFVVLARSWKIDKN